MKVCVVGSGGREHALADVLGRTADVVVAPGNAGMAHPSVSDPRAVDADLFVIGPEAPMVDGLADDLRAAGRLVLGPGAAGARLEGSKAWMKEVLVAGGVPTARHATFAADEGAAAEAFLDTLDGTYVLKTDGLAAGKGVVVTSSRDEASATLRRYLSGEAFGEAGRRCVIEQGMVGPELSVFALCDGRRAVVVGHAQDFKRVGDGDEGPNTGGMGCYTPVPAATPALLDRIMDECIEPTLAELARRGVDYRGILYAGLMLTSDGPKVVEYNVRFGDPEAQVVLPLLTGDVAGLLAEAAAGDLRSPPDAADGRAAVCVVVAAEGYPGSVRTGDRIEGLDEASAIEDVTVYCAGVARGPDGGLVTAGGRVLDVVGFGPDVASARSRAYQAVDRLHWPGCHARRDIAAAV